MIGMTNAGGGGTGCTLTVTAPVGAAITVTNTAGKVKSKTVGANGLAVFRGLTEGKWTITISNGTDTASKTVVIKADYQAEITFFSATINVTYPAGLTCTATDGVTTLTAPDTSGTWACVVPNAGKWTVSLSTGFTETVTIAATGESHNVDKWYLYKDGDQRTDLTGGWTKVGNASVTFEDDRITLDSKTSSNQPKGQVYTTNPCNLSGFGTLNANIDVVSKYNSSVGNFEAGVFSSKGTGINTGVSKTSTKTSAIVSVDISGVESLAEIYPYFYETTAKGSLLQMWLEV